MNAITEDLLKTVSGYTGSYDGAYNIRVDCQSIARRSTEHIKIESKEDAPGLVVRVLPGTKNERVYIPACVTHTGVEDLVYNDFLIGEGADVTIVAGCGVHADTDEEARHNGIHRFFLEKGAHVLYEEKHIGTGLTDANRVIDPVTEATLAEDAFLEMDTSQLGGVTRTSRETKATMGQNARLEIRERILTDGEEVAKTSFYVDIAGDGASVNLVSRSVAKGDSSQEYHSTIIGNARCTGHSECDAILADQGRVSASPSLVANHRDAALIHEAAIGKIAGEQILKLCTLGLDKQQAEDTIINGFLR